jgi:hypothetical protein
VPLRNTRPHRSDRRGTRRHCGPNATSPLPRGPCTCMRAHVCRMRFAAVSMRRAGGKPTVRCGDLTRRDGTLTVQSGMANFTALQFIDGPPGTYTLEFSAAASGFSAKVSHAARYIPCGTHAVRYPTRHGTAHCTVGSAIDNRGRPTAEQPDRTSLALQRNKCDMEHTPDEIYGRLVCCNGPQGAGKAALQDATPQCDRRAGRVDDRGPWQRRVSGPQRQPSTPSRAIMRRCPLHGVALLPHGPVSFRLDNSHLRRSSA